MVMTKDYSIRTKLALLQLAKEMNVTKACEVMGYSRDSYYRFKKLYETGGELALKDLDRRKPMLKNRVTENIEKQVVELALDYPNYGQEKVAKLLNARDMSISASGVRAIWKRHDLESTGKRLKALHAKVEQEKISLTDAQKESIERLHQIKQNKGEVDASYPGHLGVHDTLFIGELPNIGTIYQQTFIDAYSKIAIVHLDLDKNDGNTVNMLENHILPWHQSNDLKLEQMLTDRGPEFYGAAKQANNYQISLDQHNIQHIKMRAYNGSEVNGICARFHALQKSNFYDIVLRNQRFESLATLEEVLQEWMVNQNNNVPQQERYCFGKTPMTTFNDSLHLAPSRIYSNSHS